MLWGVIGMPWDTLWDTWGCIKVSWGGLGTTLGHLGLDVGMPRDHFGPYLTFGVRRNPHRKPMALKYRACAQKEDGRNTHQDPSGPAGPVQMVS